MTTTDPTSPTGVDQRPSTAAPVFAANDTLRVMAWHDPLVEEAPGAIRTDTEEALMWFTPTIGTISMSMAHRFARHALAGPNEWTIEDVARTFGLGRSTARVLRSLDRLERFGIAKRHGHTVSVRLWLAPLTLRQYRQLPGYLADAYDRHRHVDERVAALA